MAEGYPGISSSQASSRTAPNPFQRIRIRHYFWWVLFAFVLMQALQFTTTSTSTVGDLLVDPTFFVVMLFAISVQFYRRDISWGKVFGPVPSPRVLGDSLKLLPLLMGANFAGFFLLAYPLSYLAPGLLDHLLNIDLSVTAADPTQQWIYDGATIFMISLLGPLFEELLFRGILLHRWTAKWSVTTAVWASSLLFGTLHADAFLGATMVGLVMAILYLESGSLFVPLVVHAANNAFWCAVDALFEAFPSWIPLDFWRSAADIRATPWLGVFFLLAAGPPMYRYIRRHWPRTCAPMPYFRINPNM